MSTSTTAGHDLVTTIERLYDLEQRKQLEEWSALWADDAEVLFPLSTEKEKHEIFGKEELVARTAQKFIDRERTELDVRVEAMADGRRVVSHLDATIRFATGKVLSIPLLIIFTFNDAGLIRRMEEYVNEVALAAAQD
ncbi:nuclear transport factor 2 family protein [Trujillonella humicola]|uniref:nuclear transport factor 2 family protein n=1 Tax=Trujillonella humicola TaxID=3383699 RepID=UPI003905F6A0